MKLENFILYTVCFTIGWIGTSVVMKSHETFYQRYAQSVVKINVLGYHDHGKKVFKLGHGSGSFISKSGLIITAAHVTADSPVLLVETKSGKKFFATTLYADKAHDVALVIPTTPLEDSVRPLKLALTYHIGDEVYHIGSPRFLDWTISKGLISNYQQHWVISTANIGPGSSGGPLLNSQGKLIGITVAMLLSEFGSPSGFNCFAPLEDVRQILEGWGYAN